MSLFGQEIQFATTILAFFDEKINFIDSKIQLPCIVLKTQPLTLQIAKSEKLKSRVVVESHGSFHFDLPLQVPRLRWHKVSHFPSFLSADIA